MFSRHMDMRTPDRTLEHGPERFQRVHVNLAPSIFLAPVIDRLMVVPKSGQDAIRPPFVRADGRTGGHVLEDRRDEGLAAGVGDNLSEQFAAPLKDTENDSLVRATTRNAEFLATLDLAADVSLVGLYMAGQRRGAIQVPHVAADHVRHTEGGRIRNSELPLQFLGRNAVPRRGEQIHRIEPLLQRHVRPMEGGSNHWMDMVPAPLASIGRKLLEAGKMACFQALRALKDFAIPQFHKVVQASVVVWELTEKLLNCRGLRHGCLHLLKATYHRRLRMSS